MKEGGMHILREASLSFFFDENPSFVEIFIFKILCENYVKMSSRIKISHYLQWKDSNRSDKT